jgi:hypothetical protein
MITREYISTNKVASIIQTGHLAAVLMRRHGFTTCEITKTAPSILIYRVFPKIPPILIAHNYVTTYQISLYVVSLSSAALGECAAPGENFMK